MTDKPQRDTRTAILELASELFAQHGYQRTSLRELGERLGLSKAAVLYHFPAKPDILAALAEPLLDDIDAALDRARNITPATREAQRWAAIEGMLDALLTHRRSLHMVLHDMALFSGDRVFHRFTAQVAQAHRLVAGPEPDVTGRVRAAQAIAMLSDPVIVLAEVPARRLRHEVLAGVRLLFAEAAVPTAPTAPRRRTAGRPSSMTAASIETARAMHATGEHTVDEIAAAVGVSRATVYRHLSA